MNDPYDNHPLHPANYVEPVARYGYVSPNQFPAMDERGRNDPAFKGLVDEHMDIEEAEKVAQDLANDFGHPVTVEVSDEAERPIEERSFQPEVDIEIEF